MSTTDQGDGIFGRNPISPAVVQYLMIAALAARSELIKRSKMHGGPVNRADIEDLCQAAFLVYPRLHKAIAEQWGEDPEGIILSVAMAAPGDDQDETEPDDASKMRTRWVKGYIRFIVIELANKMLARRVRRKYIPLSVSLDPAFEAVLPDRSPSKWAAVADDLARLMTDPRLTDRQRSILEARLSSGHPGGKLLPLKDVAIRVGVSVDTVKTDLNQVKRFFDESG
jgi:hypothetical protein